jgi:signal transduction histidine kinase
MPGPSRSTSSYTKSEFELRSALLGRILIGFSAAVIVYLLIGFLTDLRPVFFPLDGLLFMSLCLVCWVLYRRGTRGSIGFANSWLVAGVNILAAFYSQAYGVRHPITALYLAGIVLSGMLIGGWFLPAWTAMGALFVLIWAVLEWQSAGYPTSPGGQAQAIESLPDLVGVVLIWWALFLITGWMVRLFAKNLEQAVQVARGQTTALTQTLNALVRQPAVDTILEQVIIAMAEQLQAESATLVFYDSEADVAGLRLAYGKGAILSPEETQQLGPGPLALDTPVIQEMVEGGRPFVVDDMNDIAHDPRLQYRTLMLSQGIQTVLYVPLRQGERVLGHFTVNSLEKRRFRPEEIELAQALVQQATLALKLTELSEQASESAVVEERNRLAREIHDTLAQGFTGIVIQLEAAEDNLADNEQQASLAHLARARTLARESLAEARQSVQALRPLALESSNLPDALRHMAGKLEAATTLSARVITHSLPYPLPEEVENELLRIAQEAANNSVKHGEGTAVVLELSYEPAHFTLVVRDNGWGFDPTQPAQGFGLTSMRERAARLGAELTIYSRPKEGTEIRCRLKTNLVNY